MKKILQMMAGLLLVLGTGQRAMAYDAEVDGIYYNLNTDAKTAKVTYQGASYATSAATYYTGDVTIPSTIEVDGTTYTVTAIGERAFYYCSSVTSVTMPSSITAIEGVAFQHCSAMTDVNFSENITSIADWSFGNCTKLAGEVTVDDHAILSACVLVHQFCRVGGYTMVGGGTGTSQSILPYTICARHPAT